MQFSATSMPSYYFFGQEQRASVGADLHLATRNVQSPMLSSLCGRGFQAYIERTSTSNYACSDPIRLFKACSQDY